VRGARVRGIFAARPRCFAAFLSAAALAIA